MRRFNYQVQHSCAKIAKRFVLGRKSSKVFLDGDSVRFAHGVCNRLRERKKSVPVGMYCRMSLFVFSTRPFSQEE